MSDPLADIKVIEAAKKQLIEASYGKEKAPQVAEITKELAKAVFEARKAQIKAQQPIFEKRRELIKGIDKVRLPRLIYISLKARACWSF
jgi:hypothetical protein